MDHVRISWPNPRPAIEGPYTVKRECLTVPHVVAACFVGASIWFALVCIFSFVR